MTDSSLQARFRETLLRLLRTEFKGLSEAELYSAFAVVVQDLRTNVGVKTPPKGGTPIKADEEPGQKTVALPSPDLEAGVVSDSWDLDFENDEVSLDRSFGPSLDESADAPEPEVIITEAESTGGSDIAEEAATEVVEESEETELPPVPDSGANPPPDSREGLSRKTYLAQTASGWQLAFDIFTAAALDELSEQLTGTGGLFVQLDEEVELNAAVDVCVILPVTGEELWWEGRVVFQSPAGTAIDVKPASSGWEDVIASAQAVFSATSVVPKSPTGGPRSEPPRLRKPTATRRAPKPAPAEPEEVAASPPEEQIPVPEPSAPLSTPGLSSHHEASWAPTGPASTHPHSQAPPSYGPPAHPPQSGYPQQGHPGYAQQGHPHAGYPPAHSQGAPPPGWGAPAWGQNPWGHGPGAVVHAPGPPGPLDTRSINGAITASQAAISGTLSQEHPLSLFLTQIASRQEDGLAVIRSDTTYFIVMQVGCPVDIRMEPRNPDLHLGALLVQAGALTWEAHKEAERYAAENAVSYDTALVRLRHIPYQQSLAALQSRMVYVLGHIFQSVSGGTYEYYDLGPLPQRYATPPVSIGQLAFKYVFESWRERSTDELEAVLEPWDQAFAEKITPPPIPLAEVQLSKKHKRFWDVVLASDSKVRNIPSISNMGHAPTLALMLTLRDLGFLKFEHGEQVDGQVARMRAKLRVMYDKLDKAEHYDMLSLHWSAFTALVDRAYKEHAEEFDPAAWPDEILAEDGSKLDEIQVALKRAHQVLSDKKSRAAYRETVVNSMQLLNGVQLYFRKGDMAMLRRDAREAIESFQRVLELDPRHKGARQKLAMIKDAEKKAKE